MQDPSTLLLIAHFQRAVSGCVQTSRLHMSSHKHGCAPYNRSLLIKVILKPLRRFQHLLALTCAGWLKTFDGYYEDKVRYILGNVTASMAANSSRVFNWAETSFFKRW